MIALLLAVYPAPQMVGRGVISTQYETSGAAHAADGTMVFVRSCPGTLLTKNVLCVSRGKGRRWETPMVLPFSGKDIDFNPQFSPDGKRLFFASNRDHSPFFAVWSVERVGQGWGTPVKLPPPVNGEKGHQLSASESASGDLFVCSMRKGIGALYFIKREASGYTEAVPLDTLNKVGFVIDVCVAPDESFIVFSAVGGKDELLAPGAIYQRGDLYVSLRKSGIWQTARHLPRPINTEAGESCPTLSPDGKTLYFASDRGYILGRGTEPLTYDEIRRNSRTDRNCLSKIFRLPISEVLRIAREIDLAGLK